MDGISNNKEIEDALRQLEAKEPTVGASQPQGPETVDVLHSQSFQSSQPIEVSKMVGRLMKYSGGAIKTERQAEYILLGVAIAIMAVSLYIFFGGTTTKSSPRKIREIPNSHIFKS